MRFATAKKRLYGRAMFKVFEFCLPTLGKSVPADADLVPRE
jgi:hypothetical protein